MLEYDFKRTQITSNSLSPLDCPSVLGQKKKKKNPSTVYTNVMKFFSTVSTPLGLASWVFLRFGGCRWNVLTQNIV